MVIGFVSLQASPSLLALPYTTDLSASIRPLARGVSEQSPQAAGSRKSCRAHAVSQ